MITTTELTKYAEKLPHAAVGKYDGYRIAVPKIPYPSYLATECQFPPCQSEFNTLTFERDTFLLEGQRVWGWKYKDILVRVDV